MQKLLAQAREEQTPEWRRAMDYLLASPTDYRKPDGPSYGDLIAQLATALRGGQVYDLTGQLDTEASLHPQIAHWASRLVSAGIRLKWGETDGDELGVVIANTHQQLAQVFAPTNWRTMTGAAGGGGWAQVFRRAPLARTTKKIRFKTVQSLATAIPLSVVLDGSYDPADVIETGIERDRAEGERPPAVH
jgi:hypothetical protein